MPRTRRPSTPSDWSISAHQSISPSQSRLRSRSISPSRSISSNVSNVYQLAPSTRSAKKWMIITPSGKTVHFGAAGYEDYTIHHDPKRRQSYIKRHQVREDWTNPNTSGFWAYWLLWNKPTLAESIHDVESRFGFRIQQPGYASVRTHGNRINGNINRY